MPRSVSRGLLRPWAALLLAPLLFGAGPEYVGCGGSGPSVPPEGTPLPEAEMACEEDADCPSDTCSQLRCLAGLCQQVAPMVDADGDGDAPPPCGGDCDDTRPEVGAGFGETCDGLDNDCNMLVDDGASRVDRVYPLSFADEMSIVVPWGDRFLVTTTTRSAIFGAFVSIGGEVGSPFEIQRLVRGARFNAIAGAAAEDGRVLFVTLTDDALLRYLVAQPDGDDFTIVEGPADLESGLVDIQAFDVIPFETDWAIGVDGLGSAGAQRVILTSLDAPPAVTLDVVPTGTLSFAIATDGTHLVMADPEDGLHFFMPTGEEVVGFTLPGLSRARRPLASWRGAVVALTADAFDFNLGFVDFVIGLGSVEPAPFGSSDDIVSVHTTNDLVFVARRTNTAAPAPGEMRVQAIQGDLSTYDGEQLVLTDATTGAAVEAVTVAEAGTAIGVAGGNTGGGALGVIRACGSRP